MPSLTLPDLKRSDPKIDRKKWRRSAAAAERHLPKVEVDLDAAVDRAREVLSAGVEAGVEAGTALAAALPTVVAAAKDLPTDDARDRARETAATVREASMDRTRKMRSSLRNVDTSDLVDRLPRRGGPSPVPFLLGGIVVGLMLGAWLATMSPMADRVREEVDRARWRMAGAWGSNGTSGRTRPVTDPLATPGIPLSERFDEPMGSRPAATLGDYEIETSLSEERPLGG